MDSSQNNPFGSFSSGGAGPNGFSTPVSSGANDDIILSGSAPQKSNRKLIIGIVVGVILLIGAVAGFLMMQGKNGGLGVSESSKEKFNRYANYLLYGNDSTNALEGEYNENDGAAIYTALVEDSKIVIPYADSVGKYWDEYSSSTSNFTLSNDVTRDDYDKRVQFMVLFLKSSIKMNPDKIAELAETSTKADINKALDAYFDGFKQFDFGEAMAFVTFGRQYYEGRAELLMMLQDAGCISSGDDNNTQPTCSEQVLTESNDKGEEVVNNYVKMNEQIKNIVKYLVENVWQINGRLNGGG